MLMMIMWMRMAALAVVVVAVAAAMVVNAQRYTCWGGCYNNCFLRTNAPQPEMVACYGHCLNTTCVPTSPDDYRYYCRIGCSLELCIPDANDGRNLEKCFERCNKLCTPTT